MCVCVCVCVFVYLCHTCITKGVACVCVCVRACVQCVCSLLIHSKMNASKARKTHAAFLECKSCKYVTNLRSQVPRQASPPSLD